MTSTTIDDDITKEYGRQKDYLEKSVDSLKRKYDDFIQKVDLHSRNHVYIFIDILVHMLHYCLFHNKI